MKIFIIHYKKLQNRKRDMIEQLDRLQLTDYEFIEHYDRDTLTDNDKIIFEDGYKSCQIAITLSHIYAYKQIAEKYECGLIFEDDAILHPDFINIYNNYIHQLHDEFDMFFIGHGCNLHIESQNIKPGCNVYKKQETRCTDSYLVNKICAKKIIDYIDKIKYKINSPIDFWLNIVFKDLKFEIYWAEPHIVEQGTMTGKYPSSHLYEGAIVF